MYHSPNEGELKQLRQFELAEAPCTDALEMTATHLAVQCGAQIFFYDAEVIAIVKVTTS